MHPVSLTSFLYVCEALTHAACCTTGQAVVTVQHVKVDVARALPALRFTAILHSDAARHRCLSAALQPCCDDCMNSMQQMD